MYQLLAGVPQARSEDGPDLCAMPGPPEDYFDSVTTYPGADGVFNFYPAMTAEQASSSQDIGIGSHTDLQCFTLLWQDQNGGLQVLNNEGQWIKASPVDETFVVNIADFLQRLSNDRFKSTVHRVYNRSTVDRLSMPFFFGFNFNEKCGVLPSCTSAENPAKYEPISCGEWCQLRFAMSDQIDKKGGLLTEGCWAVSSSLTENLTITKPYQPFDCIG